MQAVVLVGGEGTRLRPLTCSTVKAMVPVLNKPFLEHMVGYLASHGVDDIILTLCYLPDQIESYFEDGSRFDVRLTYVVEKSPLGTAGAVKNAEGYLGNRFLVFNGDIFTDIDLGAMLHFHRERKARATIALTPVDDPTSYGVIETEANGRVKRFLEKPSWDEVTTNLINAGIYVVDREVLQDVPEGSPFMFEHHLFPGLLANGVPVYGYPSGAYWIDIGTPEKYMQLHRDLLQGKGSTAISYQNVDAKPRYQAASSFAHPTATIQGPVVVANGCTIGAGVSIQGPACIGEGCTILDGAVVDRAVLWRDVRVGQQATLRSCIVGDGCRIGDRSCVDRGSVVGDRVVVNQGCHVGCDSKIWPGTEIRSIHPPV